ncbi:hypothetical protein JJV70_20755 [Streptomyces sp. JJ66]|uniref:hypothetical protein n=1 Tax=Streptomyces sp. JJ66 TaxID=2803843 RepID=UPI001C57E44D|nr:hypothetical protein [Streptomyces sp. JJ66]MBW1604488.1 hypothetical protein [Streptomyces sp. JJ66]
MPDASPAKRSPTRAPATPGTRRRTSGSGRTTPAPGRATAQQHPRAGGEPDPAPRATDPVPGPGEAIPNPERLRRRALFLRELSEAKALRDRVQPRRARAARMREQMRMRTFRW